MNKTIKHMLSKYSNKRGKINCIKALEIAKTLNIHPKIIGDIATLEGLKIDNCELAQFGSRRVGKFNKDVYNQLKKYTDEKNRIECVDAMKIAEKYGLYKVRSTIKNSEINVIYCQLGCFREKKRPRLQVKTKVWIENKEIGMVFGKGKLEILELIDKMGSISAVAKELDVSYKKVWNHIQVLENNMNKKYVLTAKGRGIGGSVITKEAREFIDKFKKLQREVEKYANERFVELFYEDRKFKKQKGARK